MSSSLQISRLRGIDDPVRSLAEAFPEVYEILRDLRNSAEAIYFGMIPSALGGDADLNDSIEKADRILARMEGKVDAR